MDDIDPYKKGAAISLGIPEENISREQRFAFKSGFYECLRLRLLENEFPQELAEEIRKRRAGESNPEGG